MKAPLATVQENIIPRLLRLAVNICLVLTVAILIFAGFVWSEYRQIEIRMAEAGPPAFAQLIAVRVFHLESAELQEDAGGVPFSISQGNGADKVVVSGNGRSFDREYDDYGFEQVVGRLWIEHPGMGAFSGYGFATSKNTYFNRNVASSKFRRVPDPPFGMNAAVAKESDVEHCDPNPTRYWSWQFWSFLTSASNTNRCVLMANTGYNFPILVTLIHWQNYLQAPNLRRRVCEELIDPEYAIEKATFGACIFVDEFKLHKDKYPAQVSWFEVDEAGLKFLGPRKFQSAVISSAGITITGRDGGRPRF